MVYSGYYQCLQRFVKKLFYNRTVDLTEMHEQIAAEVSEEDTAVIEAVLRLPEKYRKVIYLHYYEGYTAPEISEILGKNVNTVSYMQRARQMLKKELGGEYDAE
nr:RNA polymerase sigma factor [uncultured Anaerotignum sp.]